MSKFAPLLVAVVLLCYSLMCLGQTIITQFGTDISQLNPLLASAGSAYLDPNTTKCTDDMGYFVRDQSTLPISQVLHVRPQDVSADVIPGETVPVIIRSSASTVASLPLNSHRYIASTYQGTFSYYPGGQIGSTSSRGILTESLVTKFSRDGFVANQTIFFKTNSTDWRDFQTQTTVRKLFSLPSQQQIAIVGHFRGPFFASNTLGIENLPIFDSSSINCQVSQPLSSGIHIFIAITDLDLRCQSLHTFSFERVSELTNVHFLNDQLYLSGFFTGRLLQPSYFQDASDLDSEKGFAIKFDTNSKVYQMLYMSNSTDSNTRITYVDASLLTCYCEVTNCNLYSWSSSGVLTSNTPLQIPYQRSLKLVSSTNWIDLKEFYPSMGYTINNGGAVILGGYNSSISDNQTMSFTSTVYKIPSTITSWTVQASLLFRIDNAKLTAMVHRQSDEVYLALMQQNSYAILLTTTVMYPLMKIISGATFQQVMDLQRFTNDEILVTGKFYSIDFTVNKTLRLESDLQLGSYGKSDGFAFAMHYSCPSNCSQTDCKVPLCNALKPNDPQVCQSRGICVSGKCICLQNSLYTGQQCEIPICYQVPATNPLTCGGHGTCDSPNICTCNSGYTGDRCQEYLCYGKSKSANGVCGVANSDTSNGICVEPNLCQCQTGFSGKTCDVPISKLNTCASPLYKDTSVSQFSSWGTVPIYSSQVSPLVFKSINQQPVIVGVTTASYFDSTLLIDLLDPSFSTDTNSTDLVVIFQQFLNSTIDNVDYTILPQYWTEVTDITFDLNNNIYIVGKQVIGSTTNFFVAKYNSTLDIMWNIYSSSASVAFGSTVNSITIDSETNNLYIIGKSRQDTTLGSCNLNFYTNSELSFVAKVNALTGECKWSESLTQLSTSSASFGTGIVLHSDSSTVEKYIVMAGVTPTFSSTGILFLYKILDSDLERTIMWDPLELGGVTPISSAINSDDVPFSSTELIVDSQQNYYIAAQFDFAPISTKGETKSFVNSNMQHTILFKFGTNAEMKFAKLLEASQLNCQQLIIDTENTILLTCLVSGSSVTLQAFELTNSTSSTTSTSIIYSPTNVNEVETVLFKFDNFGELQKAIPMKGLSGSALTIINRPNDTPQYVIYSTITNQTTLIINGTFLNTLSNNSPWTDAPYLGWIGLWNDATCRVCPRHSIITPGGLQCIACAANEYTKAGDSNQCYPCGPQVTDDQGKCADYNSQLFGAVFGTMGAFFLAIAVIVIIVVIILVVILIVVGRRNKKHIVDNKDLPWILDANGERESGPKFNIDKSMFMLQFEDLKDLEEIGQGASGTVYRCKWHSEDAAVKVFKTSVFSDENEFAEFEKELSTLSSLRNTNILNFYGACLKQPYIGIVTEFCEKGSLASVIQKETGRVPWKLKMSILIDIARGMTFLHAKDIIHRDLKCDNVLITKHYVAKISDFGSSKKLQKENTLEQQRLTRHVGTSYYIAPEVVMGQEYDYKCDVFSMGILLFEFLVEDLEPYKYNDKVKNMMYIEAEVARDPTLRPQLPPNFKLEHQWYWDLCEKCWQHDPKARPDFEQVLEELENHMPKK